MRRRYRVRGRGRTDKSRGRDNERKAREALETLKEGGSIASYFVSEPNDERDRSGVDAGFTSLDGSLILFQIKSSKRWIHKHILKHPDIPCVNLHGCTCVPDVVALLLERFELPAPS